MINLIAKPRSWPYKKPFRIASGIMKTVDTVDVTLTQAGFSGHGEGIGMSYKGETSETILADIERVRADIEAGATRQQLQSLLPHGGARNALDCAYWDLECKRDQLSIWQKLGRAPRDLTTVYTIGIDTLEAMAADAASASVSILKIKIDGDAGLLQVRAVREARPDARIIVDANRSLRHTDLSSLLAALHELGVEMVEQPLEMGEDSRLEGFVSPIPLCADESCLTLDDLDTVAPYYDFINIKLDKTGGLTHALDLAEAAKARGLKLMVGCMAGTSLSMAPAFVVGQDCVFVDIDGPLLMKSDRASGMKYLNGNVSPPSSALWG